jgi:tRNA threonylcarbamoyladenosine biosynthesis protein TsaE
VESAELTLEALRAWGRAFGAALVAPRVITLTGDLGAGKTTLVQAIAAGMGVTDPVTSPTYALVQSHASPKGTLHHLDLYRLRDASQLAQLGWEDLLRERAIVCIEWPERAGEELPRARTELSLAYVPTRPDLRRLSWTA